MKIRNVYKHQLGSGVVNETDGFVRNATGNNGNNYLFDFVTPN